MKIFQREQPSLFGEILDWMLTPLLLLWPVSLGLTWLVAQNIAGRPFDKALEVNVRTLSNLVLVRPSVNLPIADTNRPRDAGLRTTVQFPIPALDMLDSKEDDPVFYQVLGTRGELVAGERDLPLPPDDDPRTFGEVRLRDGELNGTDIRIAHAWVVRGPANSRPVLVQVAETRVKRAALATDIIKGVMLPQFASMPLAVLLVWLGLVRGMRPLNRLAERIRARSPNDLRPIEESDVLQEVAPLVNSVNGLLQRLKDSVSTQKRFLADAAHQLKTPLAGLRMQAELALREGTSAQELKQSLRHMARASVRATHTVNQLLALARAETTGKQPVKQSMQLARVVADVVQDALTRALNKSIDLGYEGPSDRPGTTTWTGELLGNPMLIQEMVRNLVDNALAYTPNGGVVTVRLLVDRFSGLQILQVEDSGPGIAPAERLLVFDPFYRALGNEADGSGLGLTIVKEIASQHSATVDIADAKPGQTPPGTVVSVRFPGAD